MVAGAGPAGSAAALVLARAGRSVLLLERGEFPGSKNVSGGSFFDPHRRPSCQKSGQEAMTIGIDVLDHSDGQRKFGGERCQQLGQRGETAR